jgi:Na+/proline symporter
MAVTSSFSAEIVAHASIITYDIYKPCKSLTISKCQELRSNLNCVDINPKATDAQLKLVSHMSLAGFAIFSASFATALNVCTPPHLYFFPLTQ